MRIGIIAFLHESNTFSGVPTTIDSFRQDILLEGEAIREELEATHHEVGGFLGQLDAVGVQSIPLFAARALPSGRVTSGAFAELINHMKSAIGSAGRLDGILVAPHGATVSEEFADADGYWLTRLRQWVGSAMPIVATIDAHANLSSAMVQACHAIIGYRTNPHTDQRERGLEAASLLVDTIRNQIRPTMTAAFPPLAIRIDRQCSDDPHLQPIIHFADQQMAEREILSNSIVLGFPYADVAEMGSSVIVVTDGDQCLADEKARVLAAQMWQIRHSFGGPLTEVDQALDSCSRHEDKRFCLLDMGDNVGGGSSADGTTLIGALHDRSIGPSFACLFDPEAVKQCVSSGIEGRLRVQVGGKTDDLHGDPLSIDVTVRSIHEGRFTEQRPRHGGFAKFDQGRTAICDTNRGLTLMLTSRRMVPFSLGQLTYCNLDPRQFRILVAKGVNAPIAAYREVCDQFIRVNTIGATCADMSMLTYHHRRRPMFPFEDIPHWTISDCPITQGAGK